MSDIVSRALANFAQRTEYGHLDELTIQEIKRRLIDSLACLLAGYEGDATVAARKLAKKNVTEQGATLIGTEQKVSAELATFANGTAIRYLDYNDTYLSVEPQHPSDVLAPLIAMAEERQIEMTRLLTAIAVAYEVGVLLCDHASLKKNGWDHVNYITVATVTGLANLLQLSVDQTEQALALAIVPHAAMRQTRNGEISMWKGAAAANAARNAVFAVHLAECGMRGPYEPFAGTMGFNYQLLNQELSIEKVAVQLDTCFAPRRVLKTYTKSWPVEYMAQSGIDAALALRDSLISLNEVKQIKIETFQLAYDILAKDAEKWEPKTRETADHSLPYLVVVALEDGLVSIDSFAAERIADQKTQQRIKEWVSVEVKEELTARYPIENPTKVSIVLHDGRVLEKLIPYPLGHTGQPMNNHDIEGKFTRLTTSLLSTVQQENVLNFIWSLEQQQDFGQLFANLILEQKRGG